MSKGASTTFKSNRLWTVTDGAERDIRLLDESEAKIREITEGLAKCPVCKRPAKLVRFGFHNRGVWIGCDRTEECSRYIERHSEGWSIEDTAECWNRRNSGMRKAIRMAKRWFRVHFGSEVRAERRRKRELAAKKRAEIARRREVFGIIEPKKAKKWWKLWQFGQ